MELEGGLLNFSLTVEPLLNGHLWDKKVTVVDRWPLWTVAVGGGSTEFLNRPCVMSLAKGYVSVQYLGSF